MTTTITENLTNINPSIKPEKISLLLPTRERPESMRKVWKSAIDTADHSKFIEICFYIDEDDIISINEANAMASKCKRVKYKVGPRIVLAQCWNECYKISNGEILMQCGDDIIFRSKHWDTIVRNMFRKHEDRIMFVHGDDGVKRDINYGTHGFLHRNWVKVVGYFVPPFFSSDYTDTWINEMSKYLGRHYYVKDIYTEHMHFTLGKAEIDQNTKDRLERHKNDKVEKKYAQTRPQRIADATKLYLFIQNYQKLKNKI